MNGFALWLFSKTKATERSVRAKTISSAPNEIKVNAPWTAAIDRIVRPASMWLRKAMIISTN